MTTASTIPPVDSATEVPVRQVRTGFGGLMSHVTRRLLGKGALSVLDQAIVSGASFLTSVLIGRACSQGELGIYYLAMSILLFVRAVQSDVVSAPYMMYCHRHEGDSLAKYTGSSLIHQLILTILTLLGIGVLQCLLLGGMGPTGLLPTTYVLLGVVPLILLREFVRQLSFSHLNISAAVGMDMLVAMLQLTSLVWLFQSQMLTVERSYVVIGVTCGLGCCGWLFCQQKALQFDLSRVRADWYENWNFAKWALSGQLVSRFSGYIMPWIITLLHGEAATGLLAVSMTLVNLAGMFVTGVSNFLTPRSAKAYAHGGLQELLDVLAKAVLLYAAVIGTFFLLMLMAGEQLAQLIYGAGFTGAGPVLAILAFGMLANSLGLTAGNGLWALDRAKANFLADLANLLVTFGVLLCVVGTLGVLGAAIATTAGFVVGAIVRWLTLIQIMTAIRKEQSADKPIQP